MSFLFEQAQQWFQNNVASQRFYQASQSFFPALIIPLILIVVVVVPIIMLISLCGCLANLFGPTTYRPPSQSRSNFGSDQCCDDGFFSSYHGMFDNRRHCAIRPQTVFQTESCHSGRNVPDIYYGNRQRASTDSYNGGTQRAEVNGYNGGQTASMNDYNQHPSSAPDYISVGRR